ncbi:MAG: sialate O-acetylesterase [Verrucomicrobia bacterium]|nr:sialate O-acetylesterase [Verrucomicrobiota bacterium]
MLLCSRSRFWVTPALLLAAVLWPAFARADVSMPALFSDNMVIQAGAPFVIWGRATEGEKVEIEVSWGHPRQTVAGDAQGKWQAKFGPPAGKGPHQITFRGRNTIHIRNVLAGEVWICAGQSNMAMQMASKTKDNRGVLNYAEEIAAAKYPEIRYFLVSREKNASAPAVMTDLDGEWKICSPQTAGDFSAVAYLFGEQLHRVLRRPVGLIDNSWGGTDIQAWMSPAALASDPDFAEHLAAARKGMDEMPAEQEKYRQKLREWQQQGANPADKPPAPYWHPGHRNIPSGLYHARIAPLFPVSVQGVLWYQGERNAPKAWLYQRLLPAMIRDWRGGWGRDKLSFLVVQLPLLAAPGVPAKTYSTSAWAELREAQLLTAKSMPHVALAVALDAGEDHIHPRNKRPVGERLALLARAKVYGEKLVSSGPLFSGIRIEGDKLEVAFDEVGSGLRTNDGAAVRGFVVAGADRQFYPAESSIVGHTIVVHSAQVAAPVAVRYAWADFPDGNLFNREGLPASPFRSDHWPESTYGVK